MLQLNILLQYTPFHNSLAAADSSADTQQGLWSCLIPYHATVSPRPIIILIIRVSRRATVTAMPAAAPAERSSPVQEGLVARRGGSAHSGLRVALSPRE